MARFKNANWQLRQTPTGRAATDHDVTQAILMDIRDELQQLNTTLGCYRVRRMCDDVNRIDRRIAKHLPLKPKAKKRAR